MYGIVLLAAMSAGENTAQWNRGWSCPSIHGGHGPEGYGGYGLGSWCEFGAQYGSCYGHAYGGWGHQYGGWGQPYNGYGPAWPGYACFGGCGGYSSPAYGMPGPAMVTAPERTEERKPSKEVEGEVSADRAKIIIDLPAAAKLFIDGEEVLGASKIKNFQTPTLEKDQYYYYEMRVEVKLDGKPVTEARRLMLKAGGVYRADFSSLGAIRGVTAAGSR